MVKWCGRVSAWGRIETRRKRTKARVHRRLLYAARTRLVTTPMKERTPARGEAGHGVEVASMRQEEMRTSSSS
jgi:hypothetical protein